MLDATKPHEVKRAPISIAGMKAGQLMLVPTPRMIDDYIRAIPHGASVDVKTMRAQLASRFGDGSHLSHLYGVSSPNRGGSGVRGFDRGAPLTDVTPIWRVLDERTPTTKKVSFDAAFIITQRTREGL